MLKKVQCVDWKIPTAYAPAVVDALVNVEHLTRAVPTEDVRGRGRACQLHFVDGGQMTVLGAPEDFAAA